MGNLIQGAHHIAIKCKDEEQFKDCVRFYVDVLQMEVVRTWGEGAGTGMMVSTGDCMMELFASGLNAEKGGTVNHIALRTEDVDACIEAVREAGFKVTTEPTDIVIGSAIPYPARIAFCIGAAGEEVEFFKER